MAAIELANAQVTDELQTLKSTSSTSTADAQTQQAQIAKLESSNRETLSLLTAKSTSYDKLADDLTAQHKKTVELRREISVLEERVQTAENSASKVKFTVSNLQSELELVRGKNEYLESELKTKAGEHSKYRKEKSARIAEVQRTNEDATQQIEGLQQTESTLRKRLEELGQKADEAFARIQQVQEDAARTEESYRLELDNAKRLADLQKQSADTARRRVQEVEEALEQTKDDAAEEISQGLAEVDTERQGRQAAEQKVEQLEEELAGHRAAQASLETQPAPATPQRKSNGFGASIAGLMRGGSPAAFSPGASSRGGLTFTQLYAEHNSMKAELDAEKRRSDKLTSALDGMIHEMEQREPEAQESRVEHERLLSENADLSTMLAQARQEKDTARKEARKLQGLIEAQRRESDLLKQQLRDLSAQIKVLLVEVQIRENGVEFNAAERLQLQQAASGAGDIEALDGMSDTARFISQRLISFKNVFELQEKNAELTRIVRDIGEQQEASEATSQKLRQTEQERDAANERLERYKDEMKSMVAQSQSYIRERDMFRRMLSHRGQIPADTDLESMFGASVNGTGSPRTPQVTRHQQVEQTPSSKEAADLARLLKEYQGQFDAYRRETGTDMTSLKDQNASLSKEKSHLQGDIARISSQLTLAHERYSMLQANLEQSQSENTQLQTRAQSVMESAAKQDLKTQHVAEELVEARGLADSMRNENANLKAEKELAKRIEARLQEDNKFLQDERTRLGSAMSETQRLFNEREMSDNESRRKLQSQIEQLEAEMRTLKQKLEDEIETSKAFALRKDYEAEQSRTRIDDLVKMVGIVKEESVAAKTVRDQLQARVDELKIELRNAEDRAQALQPRPTPRPAAGMPATTDASALAREQELALEIADLRKEFELTRNELENAHDQVEQYKAIAQSSEEELGALNETQDQYREEMDKIMAEKESKIRDLEQRVEDISSELNTTNSQLSELRGSAQDVQSRLDQQQATFETELAQVKDESEKHKEAAAFHQEDLKAQAEIAQQAQQSYENELVKHGEATKSLHTVRTELNQLKLEVSGYKADAEAARTTMAQSEESWLTNKEKYEKELIEIKNRRDDVLAQNKVLHEQLENFSKQIATLQAKRSDAERDATLTTSTDAGMQNLQEVIKFLRGEKEIVDVQLELATQETRRLRQQVEYNQGQLEETRLKLEEVRQKQADKDRSAMNHSKLMDTINELNVFRESNVTLRNQLQQIEAQLAEKTKQSEDLTSQLQPLQTSVRELESEKETTQGELKLLEEDRNRWQQRTQNILQKYDRIDPAELESLKEQLTQLQTERDEAVASKGSLQEQVDRIPEDILKAQQETKEATKNSLAEQFKQRSRELSGKIKEANNAAKTSKEQYDTAAAELELARSERDAARSELKEAIEARDEALAHTESAKPASEEDAMEDGQVNGDVQNNVDVDLSALRATVEDAEARVKVEADKVQAVQSELDGQRSRFQELEIRVRELEEQLAEANSSLTSLRAEAPQAETNSQSGQRSDGQLAEAKQDLETAQQEIAALRIVVDSRSSTEPAGDGDSVNSAAQIASQVAQIRSELESSYNSKAKELEEVFTRRAEGMKKQLSEKLGQGRIKAREEITQAVKQEQADALRTQQQEHEAQLTNLKQEHDVSMTKLREVHEAAMTKLRKDHVSKITDLNTQHRKEVDDLRSHAAAVPQPQSLPTPSSTVAPATENAFNEDGTIKVKSEVLSDADHWTPVQAQEFVNTNPGIKAIVVRNIKHRMEAEAAKLKEQGATGDADDQLEKVKREAEETLNKALSDARVEAEKALTEARAQAEKAKEAAVAMEIKKSSLKNNLLEGSKRTANAKLEYVSKAATDTPERDVKSVWLEAKDIRPPPITTPATSTTAGQPPAAAQSPRPPQTPGVRRTSTIPNATPATDAKAQLAPTSQSAAETTATQATTNTARPASDPAAPTQPAARVPASTNGPASRGNINQASALPRAPNQPRSGLPVPGASGIARGNFGGRGRGGGRGNGQGGRQSQGGDSSPGAGRGNMNPGAGNFVPGGGSKRPAGDHAGGDGKRARGGGAGQ